jgi:hypothetical protein
MRMRWMTAGLMGLAQSVSCAFAQPVPPHIPAAQLVREVVYNELNDHRDHGFWRYWIESRAGKETQIQDQVETAEGPVTRLALSNGLALSAATQQQEEARLQRLLASPQEQARRSQEFAEDEARIGSVMSLMPDAFLYQYEADENGCQRLSFRPNPHYSVHSIEARVLHAMSGTLWIDARMKRVVRVDGHVEENLDFGYGILGRLYKGGWFQLERTQVSPTEWKTDRLEVHLLGRALLVRSFTRETSEVRGGFAPVPPGMDIAQGLALLQQSETQAKTQTPVDPAVALAPAVLALRP